ncbi:Putative sulfatase AslA [Frankliniella fusca]|uniref:Sulfatase AslA n=1 Tax=Frankliniella fusca TaxID=407009 RepID=A0AAE1LBN8_9NEOP|nr:Putative sulfatase AslA [Frankliniella fusca]
MKWATIANMRGAGWRGCCPWPGPRALGREADPGAARGRGRRGVGGGVPSGMFLGLACLAAAVILFLVACSRLKPYRILYPGPRLERTSLHSLNNSFLVDTPGCRIPNLAVMSPEVQEFVYDYAEVTCDEPPALVRSDDEYLYLVRSRARHYGVSPASVRCCTRALWLQQANFTLPELDKDGVDNSRLAAFKLPPGGSAKFGDVIVYSDDCTPFADVTRVPHEFVRVECQAEGREVYRDFHGFVRVAPRPRSASPGPARGLSVLLLGADNLSRLNMLRSMPRTLAKLESLGAVTMLGYNKARDCLHALPCPVPGLLQVDDYSYVNLVPLLAGQPSREMERRCLLDNSVFFDPCPWLWKRFARRGYRTALMEDTPRLGLFHFHSPGFARRPVDVDPRALLLAAERELPRTRAGTTSPVCLGPRFQIQGLFDFALKFVRAMVRTGTPFFQYAWGTSLTHDYLNQAQIADPVYERFLKDLEGTGALNTTALVFLSDHGNRVGPIVTTYQGHVEDRLPVLSFVLPPWLHRRYPLAVSNLRLNTRRLVTVMDVHETVAQLADLASLEAPRLRAAAAEVRARLEAGGAPPRALSLFLAVPDTRTCAHAGIVPHFCACVHLAPARVDDPRVLQAARLLVDDVNAALAPHPQCARLALGAVRAARRGEPASLLGQRQDDVPDRVREQEFLITVQTTPGDALLEGTVRHLVAEDVMRLAGRVTRLNKYGNSSWCAPERALMLYCYCTDPNPDPDPDPASPPPPPSPLSGNKEA